MVATLPLLADAPSARATEEAGFGALTTAQGPLPLQSLDVRAAIAGLTASVTVSQTFVNVYPEPLEATYVFPLPDRAAVTACAFTVAGRRVEAQLQERGQARRTYDRAIQAGHRAAIAEEERPDTFSLRVGNLPPGEAAEVTFTLVQPLPYSDGEATFRFPLVVAPRYISGKPLPGPAVGSGTAADTDAVPDASRISPPVLLPGFPSPVRLGITVDLLPSELPIANVRSSLHAVFSAVDGDGVRRVVLQGQERLDRDFILRFCLGGERLVSDLSVQPDADGAEGTFAVTLVPPSPGDRPPRPRDVIFVLDRSGSMGGWKMTAARRAVLRMVETLTDRDRFSVYAFDDRLETPPAFDGGSLVAADAKRRWQAVQFLDRVADRGGTELAAPLKLAVHALAGGPAERDRVLVLLTDGQVGNEDQILAGLGDAIRRVRVFTIGIDQAVNAGFLRRLADLGGGACELVESESRLDEVMAAVHRRLGTPVLTGLKLEPAGLTVDAATVTPARLPDLFPGSPVAILGRYRGPGGALVLQAADAAGRPWQVRLTPIAVAAGLPAVWARGHLRDLEDRLASGADPTLEPRIVATSLRFGVLCRFTSFVAVDKAEVVNEGGRGAQVTQPVEAPSGWDRIAEAASLTLTGGAAYKTMAAAPDSGVEYAMPPLPAARARSAMPSGAASGAAQPASAPRPPVRGMASNSPPPSPPRMAEDRLASLTRQMPAAPLQSRHEAEPKGAPYRTWWAVFLLCLLVGMGVWFVKWLLGD